MIRTAKKLEKAWETAAEANPKEFNWQRTGTADDAKELSLPTIYLTRLRRPPFHPKKDLADYISEGKLDELNYWIRSAQTIDYEKARRAGNPHRFFNGKRSGFQAKNVADEIMLDNRYFMYTADRLYRYQGGYYQSDEGFVEKRVANLVHDLWTPNQPGAVKSYLSERHRIDPDHVNNQPNLLNIRDGIYDIETGAIDKHTPDFLSTQRINVKSGARTTESDEILNNFMVTVIRADSIYLAYEMIGYCMYSDNKLEKSFLLSGSGANGKSTLMRMIATMIGKDNLSYQSLKSLSEDKFASANLFGKTANFSYDIESSTIKDSEAFKMLTSGEPITAQRKYGDGFTFENKATLVFSANAIPKSNDKNEGFYRRWIFLDMNNIIPEDQRDPDLIKTLTTDDVLSSLFRSAMIQLRHLLQHKRFSNAPSSDKLLAQHKVDNDSTRAFCIECLDSEEKQLYGQEPTIKEVRDAYTTYCEQEGIRPQSGVKLAATIEKEFPVAKRERDSKTRYWTGIKLVTTQ